MLTRRAHPLFRSLALWLFAAFAPALLPAAALDEGDIMGLYERIRPAQPTADPDKVEVLEVFWYRCPHCYRLQPLLARYVPNLPAHTSFRRMPAILDDDWRPQAQAFYAAEAMGALDKVHGPIFRAIHAERRPLATPAELKALFVANGVSAETFDTHYGSFGVDSMVRRAQVKTRQYGVRGVPAIVVNGRYKVSGSTAGSFEQMLQVADVLIELERQRMGL